jgi:hypothetical protein
MLPVKNWPIGRHHGNRSDGVQSRDLAGFIVDIKHRDRFDLRSCYA